MSIVNVESFVFWSITVTTLVVLVSMAAVVAITVSLARERGKIARAPHGSTDLRSGRPSDREVEVERAA